MMVNGAETLPALPVGSFQRTTSSAAFPPGVFGASQTPNLAVEYQDTLESLDQKVWQSLAKHARGFDLQSPEVQDQIDVTDARLKSIFDAFDQDWDGTLTRSELLQGLAQQGFPGLDGTDAFESLWEACDKAGRGGDGSASGSAKTVDLIGPTDGLLPTKTGKHEYFITFDAFKRIVQRLKIEVLFLPELHPGCAAMFLGVDTSSRAGTPVPLGAAMGSAPLPSTLGINSIYPPPSTPYAALGSNNALRRYGATSLSSTASLATNNLLHQMYTPPHGVSTTAALVEGGGGNGFGDRQARFSYVDYNEKKYRAEIPVTDPYSFFTAHRDSSDFIMRWLHLEGADRLNILRLGVKYSVHPLAVEDSLKLEEQQPKVNAYGSHYFIVVPFFRLSQHSRLGMETLRQARRNSTRESHYHYQHGHNHLSHRAHGDGKGYKKDGRGEAGKNSLDEPLEVEVEWSKLCLFVAGPPLYDTVISIHTRWEAFNTPPRFGGEGGEESKDVSVTPTGGCHHHRHVFDAIVNQLKVEYSQLRQGNSKQLLYRMLDEVVDNIAPITRAYRMRVRYFQDQLQQPDFNFTKEEIKDLINIKSELQRLQRRMRPTTSVIRHLMDDPNLGKDIKVYLDDVCEHVIRGLEEISGCIEMVDSTKEESRSLREQRGNEVLYTLTIITSVFVPLQFLTGIYGMNFVYPDGRPSMPELTWDYGYLYFWLLAGALFVCLISYFKFVKRWL